MARIATKKSKQGKSLRHEASFLRLSMLMLRSKQSDYNLQPFLEAEDALG